MKQINEGQIFKNYKKLCEYLEEQVRTGKSKQLQLKDWNRYFIMKGISLLLIKYLILL